MKPIFVSAAIKNGEKVDFYRQSVQISYGPDDVDNLLKIFKFSDGSRDLDQIAKKAKIPLNKVTEIISDLKDAGIVRNAEGYDTNIIPDTYDFVGDADKMFEIMTEVLGPGKPVKDAWLDTGGTPSFYSAIALYYDAYGHVQFAGATSTSSFSALFKATVEGYERWRSSQIRVDKHCSAQNLSATKILPYDIAPLTYFQARKSGVRFFDEKLPIDWTLGTRFDGKRICVPSDMVYYGHRDGENRIYYGNSSGIAAFTDLEEAKKRALVELIEGDALMRNWFSRKSPDIISHKALPDAIKTRINEWKKKCRTLYVLEIPSEYGKVFEAIFVSEKYPCFVSGAAATIDSGKICETIKKAVNEAEFNLEFAIKYPNKDEIKMKKIVYPVDHGRFYHSKQNAKKLNWLWRGKIAKSISKIDETSFDDLCEKLQTVSIDLSDENSSLKVVKMISPKLVPINFGFYSAHFLHVGVEKLSSRSLKLPHYFS